mmetsp:Transcript_11049/g.22856  ORF Transcript_11049/g.22856 Transcript_11049/m.22856 type:complete len:87 (-) Transcript_11049:55-315(-)
MHLLLACLGCGLYFMRSSLFEYITSDDHWHVPTLTGKFTAWSVCTLMLIARIDSSLNDDGSKFLLHQAPWKPTFLCLLQGMTFLGI